jgi:hypothetical protein
VYIRVNLWLIMGWGLGLAESGWRKADSAIQMHLKSINNRLNLKIKGGRMRKTIIIFLISFALLGENTVGVPLSVLKIEDFGAISNDGILDTEAINKAIDSCSALENGIVMFSSGTYLSGSIHLKSNVALQIEREATIQAAPKGVNAFDPPEDNSWDKYQDFGHSHFHNALIRGDSIENVSIRGEGIISGAASLYSNPEAGDGDKAISFKLCKNIDIKNITINDGGYLNILATGCDSLEIYNVKVETKASGISFVGSSNVKVRNCEVKTGNDGISLKSDYSLGRKLISRDIDISGCIISAGGTALQLGPETVGDFRNIQISNITIKSADNAGIAFTSNDGAVVDGINVQNVTMENVGIPFFVNLSKRKGASPGSSNVGEIKNMRISNIVAKDVYGYRSGWNFASTVMGKSGKPLDNIVLENMRVTYKGGSLSYLGFKEDPAKIVLPKIDDYRAERYGLRPAYGLYCRYIKGLKIRNVSVDFEKEDPRVGMVLEDIEGVVVNRFYGERSAIRDFDILLDNVNDFMITGSPGVIHIEKKDFAPLDSFDVDASPNPSGEEIAAKLGTDAPPILLSDLPPLVIEKVKRELGISPVMLHVLVDKNISKVEKADGAIYNIQAEDRKGDKYNIAIREDGSLVNKKKI